MTNLIQLTDKHYAVKVPAEQCIHTIDRLRRKVLCVGLKHEIDLPENENFKILFLANTATEEDWKSVVERFGPGIFQDYEHIGIYYYTATESGHSLLKSKGIYLVNPMGEEPEDIEHLGAFTQARRKLWAEWKSYEDKTGNYLILEEL